MTSGHWSIQPWRCSGRTTLRRSVGAALVGLVLVSGCGRDRSGSTSTEPTIRKPPTASAVTATSAGRQETEPILKRRDAPPAGVAAQADFFIGGGADCPEGAADRPSIQLFSQDQQGARIAIPEIAMICFYGFSLDVAVEAELRSPDGRVSRYRLDGLAGPDGQGFPFVALPGDPLGQYTVIGRQGRDQAVLEFQVAGAQQPQLVLLSSMDLQQGAYIRFALGGFDPEQPVRLHLYRRGENAAEQPFRYQTSFTVQTDATGTAAQMLPTALDDPPSCYGIQINAQVTTGDGFCLRAANPGGHPGTVLVILASKPTERAARAELIKLQNRHLLRLRGLVVAPSSTYPLLQPGLWIVHLPLPTIEDADRVVQELAKEVPGVYAKQATPP